MKDDKIPLLTPKTVEKQLKKDPLDRGYEATQIILASIPEVGGTANQIFTTVIRSPIENRRDKMLILFAEAIQELFEKMDDFSIENLKNNDVFITTLIQAFSISVRTHQEEKLICLKNAIMNSAIQSDLDEDLQHIFLEFVDSFTPLHLFLLKFFNDQPKSKELISKLKDNLIYDWKNAPDQRKYNLRETLELLYPELKDQSYIYEYVIRDLASQRLITDERLTFHIESDGRSIPRTKALGRKFMAFISSPPIN